MTKTKILIGLLLLALIIFIIYFLRQEKNITQNPVSPQENSIQAQRNTVKGQQEDVPLKKSASAPIYDETILLEDIKKNISQWSESKNVEYLKNALLITYKNINNETSFEPWLQEIQNNSSQITLSLNKDSSIETLTSAYTIYEWFIQLSGQYEKLSPEKKQSISRDFMQIQIYINNK